MGDKVTIPRTMAGLIGVADVQNSLRRKVVTLPLYPSTWRQIGNSTTGGLKFDRNVTLERAYLSFVAAGTTSHIAKFRAQVYKNASTAMSHAIYGSTGNLWGATTGWKARELTPTSDALAAITTADRISVNITNHTDGQDRICLVLQYREALDS